MTRKLAAAVFFLGCLHGNSALALGLGELDLESFLNEPLKASVDLLNIGGLHEDEIKVRLATREDFEKMGIDRAYFLTSIKFEVELGEGGKPHIVLQSDDPVLEPYLDFIVEARWPSGRLLREYTVLVDPPVFDESVTVVSASEKVAEIEAAAEQKKTPDPTAQSGTHVDVKKSHLAPGQMPQRDFNASTSNTPRAGGRYMIHRDDTLWDVAVQARPEGASVQQTMLDIQRLNRNAFIDGNINRVKAGYIIYLPAASDISSTDTSEVLAEVRAQNAAWRESRDAMQSAGPGLRISADTADGSAAAGSASARSGGATNTAGNNTAAQEELQKAELAKTEMAERLASVSQQVQTLQRIVSIKDEQITALQEALAQRQDGGGDSDASQSNSAGAAPAAEADTGRTEDDTRGGTAPVAGPKMEQKVEQQPAAAVHAQPSGAESAEQNDDSKSGWLSYSLTGLAIAVLAGLAFFLMRRRGSDATESEEDVFADVELKDQALELDSSPAAQPDSAHDSGDETARAPEDKDNRGYGERKHDGYASQSDSSDVLAETDIYIAYGRYSQAEELLQKALGNEPDNVEYRLKLLQLKVDNEDRAGADEQLTELRRIGDADSVARAEAILGAVTRGQTPTDVPQDSAPPPDLDGDGELSLDTDFGGLAIEDEVEHGEPDDLDLSADFEGVDVLAVDDDEDLVIAAESNGLSTKLDLARAYMDMGDDDGARQILEEVIAEGSDEVKAEAQELLDRIG